MKAPGTPTATYRLQFNRDFTFAHASKIIPYLHQLGISHVYASPFLKARAGSPHGYDIVDHNALNPEIGDEISFANYVETLHEHGMGQLLDIVPNHMGVGGDDNAWWLDTLENGEASDYAGFFDIDWHPANPALRNKVLLPFLGDHYGAILEEGGLKLTLDSENGSIGVRYYEHLFPIDPRTYPQVLGFRIKTLAQRLNNNHEVLDELIGLITACRSLPRRTELSAARRQKRRDSGSACKLRLARLYGKSSDFRDFLDENIQQFNGMPGNPESFDLLHRLLEEQAYRLAYWQVAADEINYRRFFDINELAGIRMENKAVFEATHRLIRRLIANGDVNSLRIDHPDGLYDPFKYCCDLQTTFGEALSACGQNANGSSYLLVEKILASHEDLPSHWPVAGTTGYEVANRLNGLFVYPDTERSLTQLYQRFTGRTHDFDELLYQCKKLIIRSALAGELTVLANLASSVAQTNRYTRDFTYHALRDALAEAVACFPVYRTYITQQQINKDDRRYVHWAIVQAKKRSPAADIQIFDFLENLITLNLPEAVNSRVIRFTLRFQQYTAPVMAKGMEDTLFYAFNRLVSLNDVGFDPRSFGLSINAFHHNNRQRQETWPQSMATTSTHDSKRGEDVRSRINVLSELPHEWSHHLRRWSRTNRPRKRMVDDTPAPSRNDEYLFYQTLVGCWPLEPLNADGLDAFRARIEAYMLKAIKEAKVHTSWINPNLEYEEAMQDFVNSALSTLENNAFLADFIPFQGRIVRYGLLNSLSQTLLKLTVPGVPDLYQGNEMWSFNLVDPDNRRPVNYHHRQAELQALMAACQIDSELPGVLQNLMERIEDGRAKLYLTWRTLTFRREQPQVFTDGRYLELKCQGPKAEHICAFARCFKEREVLVVATRWFARLAGETGEMPLGTRPWEGTRVEIPADLRTGGYRNILTGESVKASELEDGNWIGAVDLFRHFPVALLTND
ncbi:malto-oligosyltrehalose synthase [Marinobacter sp.]|uniref:malto-oligosyltrehalose synthase n=1 Tax=Marinobacter sp. TaxID=50741 RepID=UPI003566A15D